MSSDVSGEHSATGRLFHTAGPLTRTLWSPYIQHVWFMQRQSHCQPIMWSISNNDELSSFSLWLHREVVTITQHYNTFNIRMHVQLRLSTKQFASSNIILYSKRKLKCKMAVQWNKKILQQSVTFHQWIPPAHSCSRQISNLCNPSRSISKVLACNCKKGFILYTVMWYTLFIQTIKQYHMHDV